MFVRRMAALLLACTIPVALVLMAICLLAVGALWLLGRAMGVRP